MENEVKEEIKVETKKKGNGLFTLFACVMTGIIVFLATNLGDKAAKTVDPETNGGSTTSNVASNVESNTTSNVEDTTISEIEKSYINDKISLLFSGAAIKNNLIMVSGLENPWIKVFTGLDDEAKSYIILKSSPIAATYAYENGTFKTKEIKNSVIEQGEDALEIDTDVYTANYKKLFGVNPTYVDAGGCPSYYYDSTNKVFASISACGGAGASGQMVYIDSYAKTSNSIIVTTYVGGLQYSPENTITYNDFYAGYDKMAKNTILNVDSKNYQELKITDANKTKFTKYNFTFNKAADGQYYFASIAKAN